MKVRNLLVGLLVMAAMVLAECPVCEHVFCICG